MKNVENLVIALAVAGVLLAPAAMAEATVYGQFNPAIDMVDEGQSTNATKANQMRSYGSRLGFKGTEALDGGMNINWQLEAGVNVDDGAATVFSRESNIGIGSSSMGTVKLGLQASPYKTVSRKLDVFNDTVAATSKKLGARILGGGHDTGVKNTVSYKSPSMGGFTVVAATVFGAEQLSVPVPNKKGSAIGLAAMYDNAGIFAAVAIDNKKFGDAGTGDLALPTVGAGAVNNEDNALKLGVGYSMDSFTVNAAVDTITTKKAAAPSSEAKNTNLYLGAKYNISDTDVMKAAVTELGATKTTGAGAGTATDSATQITLGYDHRMSKNTVVYALYTQVSQEGAMADPSVISLGMKHAF